uniref:WASP like actin nucleation promoting factor n=1 Tax=Latimeria chalumnae TaxID=7897 RepID=H3B4R2_LATCH
QKSNFFFFLGGGQTQASAVAQLFLALPESRNRWTKFYCGVVCLVKDNPLRSYFIRVYDLKEGKMVWEQELYNAFKYSATRPYLHTFPGDECQVALNFANVKEAEKFKTVVDDRIRMAQQRKVKTCDTSISPAPPMATVAIQNPDITSSRYRGSSSTATAKDKKKTKVAIKKRFNKADIGAPCNFQHVGHVGWNPHTGFDTSNLDPDLKEIFMEVGISEDHLKDPETSRIIYEVIEKKGGIEAVRQEIRRKDTLAPHPPRSAPLPPMPSSLSSSSKLSAGSQTRGSPPPPPPPPSVSRSRDTRPPPPPNVRESPSSRGPAPPPPPPASSSSRTTPPPPPPPPPGYPSFDKVPTAPPPPAAPPAPPPPPAPSLPTEGVQLNEAEKRPSIPGRSGLLDQIRQGIQLKSVPDGTESMAAAAPPQPAEVGGIVGALLEVMQKRHKAIHSSDENEDDGDEDDYEDEDEWED